METLPSDLTHSSPPSPVAAQKLRPQGKKIDLKTGTVCTENPSPGTHKWWFQLDESKSLYRKWLELTKHPFLNGCLGFQAVIVLGWDGISNISESSWEPTIKSCSMVGTKLINTVDGRNPKQPPGMYPKPYK